VAHGTVGFGAIEITALCDAATRFPHPLAEAFPEVPPEMWDELRGRYPEAFTGEDGWLFHDHCYLVRTEGLTALVDAGFGAAWTVAARWAGVAGNLPGELSDAGLSASDVDQVVITHLHLDHIGWTVSGPEDGTPTFPNARYLIGRADWEGFWELGDEEDRAAFDQQVRPLDAAGVLDLVDGERELSKGLTVVPTPGHTPGHQSVLVQAEGRTALLSGDLTNHPVQVTEPRWRSGGDMDPSLAAWTRRQWLDRLESEEAMLCTAHYPDPFVSFVREEGRRFVAPAG
jgi:glyoxylase-like metal-dependent hydrolase (beta-lactamase superfamily II)